MFNSRLPRAIAAFLKRYPIVDRLPSTKGRNSSNVYICKSFSGLRPLPCTIRGNPMPFGISSSQILTFSTSRILTTDVSDSDLKRAIETLTDQFMETRELMEDARESINTVYFSDDMKDASDSVKKTLEDYEELLGKLSDVQRQQVLRTIGLKMEELKAQKQALEEEA